MPAPIENEVCDSEKFSAKFSVPEESLSVEENILKLVVSLFSQIFVQFFLSLSIMRVV